MAIHKFTDLLWRGKTVPMYGDGGSRRDYTYVDDIVDGLVATLDLAPGFEILNLGAENTALRLVTWRPSLKWKSHRLSSGAAGGRPITTPSRQGERVLGIARVTIREGAARFVAWNGRKRDLPAAVVTGGAGFLGSHLCERLLAEGHRVICVDNLLTGRRENVAALLDDPRFRFVLHDISKPLQIDEPVDRVLHFASPASPLDYLELPIQTLKVGSLGTHNSLGLAKAHRARFLLASTSEVYGDPLIHPQPETYWGNVNPVGPRGVYDEAKRFAEAMTMAYHRFHKVDTRIVRIFNTYGRACGPAMGGWCRRSSSRRCSASR